MQVYWKRILTKLNSSSAKSEIDELQRCPLHDHTEPTLRVLEDPVTKTWYFRCNHSQCGFSGDAVSLIGAVKKLDYQQTLKLFLPGQPYHDTLIEPEAQYQVEDYINERNSQAEIKSYLSKCSLALRSESYEYTRTKLINQRLLHRSQVAIPKTLGVVIPEHVPNSVREFEKAAYKKQNYLIYPYTYDGRVTGVRAQSINAQQPAVKYLPIIDTDIGIFMEDNITADTKTVLVAQTEAVACTLYRAYADVSAKNLPIIVSRSFPLPARYSNITRINILTTVDAPLQLKDALRIHSFDKPVENNDAVRVYVFSSRHRSEYVSGAGLCKLLNENRVTVPLVTWIVKKIDALYKDDIDDLYRAFDGLQLSEEQYIRLKIEANRLNVSADFDKVVAVVKSFGNNQFVLANSHVVRRTELGFKGIKPSGNEIKLSNTTFDVQHKILTHENELIYYCKVKAADAPPIQVSLRTQDFNTSDKLYRAVSAAYTKTGLDPYIAFYNRKGYSWLDILARIGENKGVRQEISQLGLDDDLNIHFPRISISATTKKISPQAQIYTLPGNILEAYDGLRYTDKYVDYKDTIRKLFSNCNNTHVAGFIAGLCHVCGQIAFGSSHTRRGRVTPPRHLLYVESDPGEWTPIHQQLYQLFSGLDYVPQLPTTGTRAHLNKMSKLGVLPYIVLLPNSRSSKLHQEIVESPVSIIAQVNRQIGETLADETRISFVVPNNYQRQQIYKLNAADIIHLQTTIPYLLKDIVTGVDDRMHNTPGTPALGMYKYICNLLKIEQNPFMETLIQPYYTALGINGVDAFFHVLYQLIYDTDPRKSGIKMVAGNPMDTELKSTSPPQIFVLRDVVLLNKTLVNIISRKSRLGIFRIKSLSIEMDNQGYLLACPDDINIDTSKYWVLDRAVWDKYVERKPISIGPVTGGKIIQLKQLTA